MDTPTPQISEGRVNFKSFSKEESCTQRCSATPEISRGLRDASWLTLILIFVVGGGGVVSGEGLNNTFLHEL